MGEASDARSGGVVIDVWSDVMCPFCYLGDAILERALARFEHRDRVEIRYHSFLLMPDLAADTATDLTTLLIEKRGYPPEQIEPANAQIAERGRAVGLDYRFDRAIATSTRRAHELSHLAAGHGVQHEVIRLLFRAYFTDGRNVSDLDVLADIAVEAGLDRSAALAALTSGEYTAAVEADIAAARTLGITGVPFFVFNNTFAVSGAQPEEVFAQALERSVLDAA
ncbi:MAG: DsbA family oxidoreductase [Beutenbergiaceae bacterium]